MENIYKNASATEHHFLSTSVRFRSFIAQKASYWFSSRPVLVSTRLGRTVSSLLLGYISLRCQARGLMTLTGPCRLASGQEQ